jgi:hypothetical protein
MAVFKLVEHDGAEKIEMDLGDHARTATNAEAARLLLDRFVAGQLEIEPGQVTDADRLEVVRNVDGEKYGTHRGVLEL